MRLSIFLVASRIANVFKSALLHSSQTSTQLLPKSCSFPAALLSTNHVLSGSCFVLLSTIQPFNSAFFCSPALEMKRLSLWRPRSQRGKKSQIRGRNGIQRPETRAASDANQEHHPSLLAATITKLKTATEQSHFTTPVVQIKNNFSTTLHHIQRAEIEVKNSKTTVREFHEGFH